MRRPPERTRTPQAIALWFCMALCAIVLFAPAQDAVRAPPPEEGFGMHGPVGAAPNAGKTDSDSDEITGEEDREEPVGGAAADSTSDDAGTKAAVPSEVTSGTAETVIVDEGETGQAPPDAPPGKRTITQLEIIRVIPGNGNNPLHPIQPVRNSDGVVTGLTVNENTKCEGTIPWKVLATTASVALAIDTQGNCNVSDGSGGDPDLGIMITMFTFDTTQFEFFGIGPFDTSLVIPGFSQPTNAVVNFKFNDPRNGKNYSMTVRAIGDTTQGVQILSFGQQ